MTLLNIISSHMYNMVFYMLKTFKCVGVYVFSHIQLCDPKGCSPPASFVHGIFQARI